jgi:prepilin-type processing-associated H-X9-DG protein
MRKTNPFEIVFVVVVLVVIAFVVRAMLIQRGTRDGIRSSCLSNVKQIGLAMKQYSQDFDGQYPWHVGADDRDRAWLDLGMLFPNYCSAFKTFLCPTSRDRAFTLRAPSGDKLQYPLEPFVSADLREVISYAYGVDAADPDNLRPWTENARSTVRLLADKKAGTAIGGPGNPAKLANHGDDGRNVLYQDGHVKWKAGGDALDPDEDDDAIGPPGEPRYSRWWSDPPYYDE